MLKKIFKIDVIQLNEFDYCVYSRLIANNVNSFKSILNVYISCLN
jgi:hypothetical protein